MTSLSNGIIRRRASSIGVGAKVPYQASDQKLLGKWLMIE